MDKREFEDRLAAITAIIEGSENTEILEVQDEICNLIIDEAMGLLRDVEYD